MRRLVVLSMVAVALPALAAPIVLEQVEPVSGPMPGVRLTLSAAVTPVAHPLREPDRITLDLPGTVLGPKVRQPVAGSAPVARVRMGQLDGGTARVVLDLTERAPFTMQTQDRVVTLVLNTAAAPPPAAAIAPAADAGTASGPAAPAATPAPGGAPSAPAVGPTASASTASFASRDGEQSSGGRGLFLDYTGLFAEPVAFPEPERQPHLHVGGHSQQ